MQFALKLTVFNVAVLIVFYLTAIVNNFLIKMIWKHELMLSPKWKWLVNPFNMSKDSFLREFPASTMMIITINGLVFINLIVISFYFMGAS